MDPISFIKIRLLLSPEKNDLSPSPSPFQKLDYQSKSKSEK